MADEFEGGDQDAFERPPAFFPYGSETEREATDYGALIEVVVEGVFGTENGGRHSNFVLLADNARKLPILIGAFESQAILHVLEQKRPDRPLTHDLIKNMIERLEATLDRVEIDDFWSAVYYAKIYLRTRSGEVEIDARPSDAIALALRFEAPIYVADALLDQNLQY
ncbi:MAG: bifunctional nuclease family protein [Fimbriimonadaceae bacterium]|nr:bifunctional nuclease family protein [Fimbriimonadaceae bacterium]